MFTIRLVKKSAFLSGVMLTLSLCLYGSEEKPDEVIELNYAKLIDPKEFAADPLQQLMTWKKQAEKDNVPFLNEVQLATVRPDGFPALRTVGVKTITPDGIVFNTNPGSDKVSQFKQTPMVSMLFLWHDPVLKVARQIVITGSVSEYSPPKTILFKLRDKNQPIGWQSFILIPKHVQFSQLQSMNKGGVVEYVDYNKTDNKWIKGTRQDYLMKDAESQ